MGKESSNLMATDKRQATAAELEAVAQQYNPTPDSQLGRAIAAAVAAIAARDLEFEALTELRQRAVGYEAAHALAVASGNVDAAAENEARLSAVRSIRDQQSDRYQTAAQQVGVLTARVDNLVSDYNGARLRVERATAELAKSQRDIGKRIVASQATMDGVVKG